MKTPSQFGSTFASTLFFFFQVFAKLTPPEINDFLYENVRKEIWDNNMMSCLDYDFHCRYSIRAVLVRDQPVGIPGNETSVELSNQIMSLESPFPYARAPPAETDRQFWERECVCFESQNNGQNCFFNWPFSHCNEKWRRVKVKVDKNTSNVLKCLPQPRSSVNFFRL